MWNNVFDTGDLTNGQSMHAYMMAAEGHLNLFLSLSLPPPLPLSFFLSLSLTFFMHTLSKLFGACMHTHMYTVGELVSSIGNPQCIRECEASVGTYFALLNNIDIVVNTGYVYLRG